MTHIFVVNERTFKIHLEYMFAGTGYGENSPDFIDVDKNITSSDSVEKTFISMIADISKVREGDIIAFYVTGCKKLFGFFKVASAPFYNSKDEDYLGAELGKYLPFRIKLQPYIVFSEGISELQALDNIHHIEHPYQMCWSLIYRKLTGMRGCAFVTDYEYNNLSMLISTQNKGKQLTSAHYSYDSSQQKIIADTTEHKYTGKTNIDLDITKRLLKVTGAFEGHLQAYITQNHDRDTQLKKFLYPTSFIKSWIGNEVVCSVGEQRIDVLITAETKNEVHIRIIELKDEKPEKYIVQEQIKWYIHWVCQYIVPTLNSDKKIVLTPTIIADKFIRNTRKKQEFYEACETFKNTKLGSLYNVEIQPIEYISFEKTDKNIVFHKIF